MFRKSDLRSYQQRIATELYEHDGRLLVAGMGSGKTISALTAFEELRLDGVIRHGLVLAPTRVVNLVWPQEIESWEHTKYLNYQLMTGTPAQRLKQLALTENPYVDLTICSIDNTQWLIDSIEKFPHWHPIFDLLVIDEVSRYRNPKSKQAKALKKIIGRFKIVWAMTGTPRPNGLQDLYNPISLVSRHVAWRRSFYDWRKSRFFPEDWNQHDWRPFPHAVDQIQADAALWTSTVRDEDMPELPELTVVPHYVELPPDARQAYATMERDLFARIRREAIRDGHGDEELAVILAASRAVGTGKLAQVAQGFLYEEQEAGRVGLHLHSAKLNWLTEMLDNLAGAPALLVYEFEQDLAVLRKLLGDHLPVIGGGVSDKAAERHLQDWNAGKLPVLALHAASGGHGLNLQFGGHQILWYGLTWSAELWEQTIKRIHRPGQTEKCFVHVCLARNTIDEVKRGRVLGKLTDAEAFRQYLQRVPAQAAA